MEELSTRRRLWLIGRGLLRALVTAVVLVALYYVLPLDRWTGSTTVVVLAMGPALLMGVVAWQVRAIVRHDYPGIRAVEALAVTIPLFLLMFAAAYFVMSRDDPETFSEVLSRSDALYFTITVFSTVGFGDISPRGEMARLFVAAQMLLDLVILGLVIRVILSAVERGRGTAKG